VPLHAFLQGLAFLVADDHDRPVIEAGEAADNSSVVAERPVSVEFEKAVENLTNIVESAGALGMSGELGSLPGGQFPVEFMLQLGQLHSQLANFVLDAGFPIPRSREFLDLFLDFTKRLFKLKVIAHRDGLPDPLVSVAYDTRERAPLPSTSSTSA